jgi:dihydrolipoamide dehydrogenase
MKKNNIAVHMGTAKLSSKNTVAVTYKDGKVTELNAKNTILATGASAMVPPTWKMDGQKVISYQEAILQEKLPKSVVIIGAGAIGMEFATVWNSYGVDVTVVEMLPHVLPLEDEEAASEVAKAYTKRGVKVLAGHKVESVDTTETGVKVTVSAEGQTKVLESEQALVAIGFRPNSKGLGLEELGVRMSERGFVEIDEKLATNVPGIWAIGDLTGKLMLAHVGTAQGIVCAEHIGGVDTVTLDYEMMPRATYCQPQVASFGMTEAQAKERGYTVKVGRFPFQANGKALGLGDYTGWVKLIVDEKYGELLGATLVGPEVTELLP